MDNIDFNNGNGSTIGNMFTIITISYAGIGHIIGLVNSNISNIANFIAVITGLIAIYNYFHQISYRKKKVKILEEMHVDADKKFNDSKSEQ